VVEDEERVLSANSPSVLAPPPGVGTPAARAVAPVRRHPQEEATLSFGWGKEEENGMLKAFLNHGLVAAVIVWAGVVALMAYRLDDSPWRWAFAALAVGGIATVAIIFRIRRYVDELTKASGEQGSKS
jgi:hypothetical protein